MRSGPSERRWDLPQAGVELKQPRKFLPHNGTLCVVLHYESAFRGAINTLPLSKRSALYFSISNCGQNKTAYHHAGAIRRTAVPPCSRQILPFVSRRPLAFLALGYHYRECRSALNGLARAGIAAFLDAIRELVRGMPYARFSLIGCFKNAASAARGYGGPC